MLIGVISDTHGVISEAAINALKNCDAIIHAGDIGSDDIISILEKLCPLYKVKGNVDKEDWTKELPDELTINLGDKKIYVIHNIKDVKFDPSEHSYDVVIFGHSHKYDEYVKDGVHYLNPGGAGRKRFNLTLSLALINIDKKDFTIRKVDIN